MSIGLGGHVVNSVVGLVAGVAVALAIVVKNTEESPGDDEMQYGQEWTQNAHFETRFAASGAVGTFPVTGSTVVLAAR